jgi:heme/copper-type cytochrome/quinol oxidase subunit 3
MTWYYPENSPVMQNRMDLWVVLGSTPFLFVLLFIYFAVLQIEPWHMLGKWSTTEPHPQLLEASLIKEIGNTTLKFILIRWNCGTNCPKECLISNSYLS